MKLIQFYEGSGLKVGFIEKKDQVLDVTYTAMGVKESKDIVVMAANENCTIQSVIDRIKKAKGNCTAYSYKAIFSGKDKNLKPALPIFPTEIWGCGVTYTNAAFFRDEDYGKKHHEGSEDGFYARAHFADRPEIFYKGTVSRCAAPRENGGIRKDSKITLCEPELCLIVNGNKEVIGYTIGDDLSAWDLECENPLYNAQCKVFKGGVVLGPAITLKEAIKDPYNIEITCKITRNGKVLYEGEANTSGLKRKYEELVDYVTRCQPKMDVVVIMTGTGMCIPLEAALQVGDIVEFHADEVGTLVHGCEEVE